MQRLCSQIGPVDQTLHVLAVVRNHRNTNAVFGSQDMLRNKLIDFLEQ